MALKHKLATLDGVDEATQKLYTKIADGTFVLDVEGLEDTSGLKTALKTEREARETAEKLSKKFAALGMDPEEIAGVLSKVGTAEEIALIKAGKYEEVIEKRMEKFKADVVKQLKDKDDLIEAEKSRGRKYENQVLENHIRQAAAKAGLHAGGVEDALLRAKSVFSLNADGQPVQLKDGAVVLGKDARTPFAIVDWFESVKPDTLHWYPASGGGGGSKGNKDGGGADGKKIIKRSQFNDMPHDDRPAFFKDGGKVVDD